MSIAVADPDASDCGDGACSGDESCSSCAADCGSCASGASGSGGGGGGGGGAGDGSGGSADTPSCRGEATGTPSGTTYYVAPTGDDSYSCDEATNESTPRRTIMGETGGFACLQAPGDRLLIREGTSR